MAKTRSSSKDADSSSTKKSSKSSSSSASSKSDNSSSNNNSVSIFTVFLISGITNAIVWFLISSTNVAHVDNWDSFKGSLDSSVKNAIKSMKTEIEENLATKSAMASVAKISAMNTKTVQEVKTKFGGFDLSDFNKRINSLGVDVKQSVEDMKFYVKDNFGEDMKQTKFQMKQLEEDLEEKFKQVKVEDINQSLNQANLKRDEIFVLLEEVKKSQSEVIQKMQGVGSNNDKLETTLGKKLGNLEDEMYKLQGEYVKLQELAGQAENFNIWHETVGKELENTSDSLIKSEQEILEKFTKMQSEMTVLKPIGMDLDALRDQHKKIFNQQSEIIRKLNTELAVVKQNFQIQENEVSNLKEAIVALEKEVGVKGGSFVADEDEKVEVEKTEEKEEEAEKVENVVEETVKDEL